MDGAQNLVKPQTVLHGQHVLGQQLGGMAADDGDAQNLVLAGHGQHFDETPRLAVGNGAVQLVHAVPRDLAGDALLLRLLLVQADSSHFGVYEGGLGNHRVVGLEQPEVAKQRVDRGVPGLVRRHMGELVGPGHVAGGVDIGVNRLQIVVGGHGALRRDAERFQAVAFKAGHAADGANQLVELDALFAALMLCHQRFHLARFFTAQRLVTRQHAHSIGLQRRAGQR